MTAGEGKLGPTMARWLVTLLLAASAVVLVSPSTFAHTGNGDANDS